MGFRPRCGILVCAGGSSAWLEPKETTPMGKNAAKLLVSYVGVAYATVGVYMTYALPGLVFADAGVLLAVYGVIVLFAQSFLGR